MAALELLQKIRHGGRIDSAQRRSGNLLACVRVPGKKITSARHLLPSSHSHGAEISLNYLKWRVEWGIQVKGLEKFADGCRCFSHSGASPRVEFPFPRADFLLKTTPGHSSRLEDPIRTVFSQRALPSIQGLARGKRQVFAFARWEVGSPGRPPSSGTHSGSDPVGPVPEVFRSSIVHGDYQRQHV